MFPSSCCKREKRSLRQSPGRACRIPGFGDGRALPVRQNSFHSLSLPLAAAVFNGRERAGGVALVSLADQGRPVARRSAFAGLTAPADASLSVSAAAAIAAAALFAASAVT